MRLCPSSHYLVKTEPEDLAFVTSTGNDGNGKNRDDCPIFAQSSLATGTRPLGEIRRASRPIDLERRARFGRFGDANIR
jgi:hypothetical protein